MRFLVNLDLNLSELQNAVIQPLAASPSVASSKLGQVYYNSVDKRLYLFNGEKWEVAGVVVEASDINGNLKINGFETKIYDLPVATSTVLGGVKAGTGMVVTSDGTLSVDTINNLITNDATKPLSAAQGKALKDAIDSITVDIGDLGGGDMLRATYDSNKDGIVDDSEKLGGQLPSYYAALSDLSSVATSGSYADLTDKPMQLSFYEIRISAGSTSVVQNISNLIKYHAYDAVTNEEIIINCTKTGTNTYTFSIASAYENDITISIIFGSNS